MNPEETAMPFVWSNLSADQRGVPSRCFLQDIMGKQIHSLAEAEALLAGFQPQFRPQDERTSRQLWYTGWPRNEDGVH